MKFCADTASFDIPCSIFDIHQPSSIVDRQSSIAVIDEQQSAEIDE
ncbi:MAG: hypothetical protein NTV22_16485 [bacterium]|nr:hypothetical protein [bacterium]